MNTFTSLASESSYPYISKHKMKEWRPYFMSILIHWYYQFLENGMNEPDEVKQATAKYKVDNDKFNEFFDEILYSSCDSALFS